MNKELKPMTVENLKADSACSAGLAFVTPLIEAKDKKLATKLIDQSREWWEWAVERDYDVFSTLDKAARKRHDVCNTSSNSGIRGSSSNSGIRGSSSNSGYGGSSSNSGYGGSSSNSGIRGSSSNSGYGGSSSNSGAKGIAVGLGTDNRVSGADGSCLACTWWDEKAERPRLKVGYTGEDLKPDTWYKVIAGEWVEIGPVVTE